MTPAVLEMAKGLVFTDLSVMIYMVPLIVAALVILFLGTALNLSTLAELRCPVCKTKFSDVLDFRKHLRKGEPAESTVGGGGGTGRHAA